MSPREEFAGVAPRGRIIMSGPTTGLKMLEQALSNWPVLESTKGGGPPPRIDPKHCKLHGRPPPGDTNTIEDSARASRSLIHTPIRMNGFMRNGSILMRISLAIRGTRTDPLPLFSLRMHRQFLDFEAEHLDIEAEHIPERTVVGRGAEHLQQQQ